MTVPPLVEELAPAPDPVVSCAKLAGLPDRVFLDSARDHETLGRYSFLTADPWMMVRSKGATVELEDRRDGSVRQESAGRHALEVVRELLAPHRTAGLEGLPPFQGGAAGYLGYDWGAVLERLPAPRYDDLAISDVMLGLYDWVLAWDHLERRCWLISTGMPERGDAGATRAAARRDAVRGWLATQTPHPASVAAPSPRVMPACRAPAYPVRGVDGAESAGICSSFTHRGYLDAVRRVREYIVAGDIFQANIAQRLEAPLREPAWSLYERLRAVNPAPFAAFLDFGDLAILSASPERFLRVDGRGAVEARPIKGTRPRGFYPEHDAALACALVESEKDRAENLMIVDLLRNDLSRVCRPGSVRVPELFAVEHYATVHHLVSTVIGTLEPPRDAVDLLAATFPGGSITGAPKIRAMQIIAELEPSRRGVYCGSVGYLGTSGVLDMSIVIRTYLALGDRVYFAAGGGLVADSDPEQEYRETLDKARALIDALALPDAGRSRSSRAPAGGVAAPVSNAPRA